MDKAATPNVPTPLATKMVSTMLYKDMANIVINAGTHKLIIKLDIFSTPNLVLCCSIGYLLSNSLK